MNRRRLLCCLLTFSRRTMTTGDAAELCRPYATGEAWGQREISRHATMDTETEPDSHPSTREAQVRLMSYHLSRRIGRWSSRAGTFRRAPMSMKTVSSSMRREPLNKGRLIGQKRPLRPKEVWAIRVRLEIAGTKRNLALFNLAIDSKLRACDLVVLRIEDVCLGGHVRDRATIIQRKTGRPVQFEITEATRAAVQSWISTRGLRSGFLFPSRQHDLGRRIHRHTRGTRAGFRKADYPMLLQETSVSAVPHHVSG